MPLKVRIGFGILCTMSMVCVAGGFVKSDAACTKMDEIWSNMEACYEQAILNLETVDKRVATLMVSYESIWAGFPSQ